MLYTIISLISCAREIKEIHPNKEIHPKLLFFEQKKLESYLDHLDIHWRYETNEIKELKKNVWYIEINQNQEGGLCEKNFRGEILIQSDTIFLLADYIYNERKYENTFFETPVSNCGSKFCYTLTGIVDIKNYKIIFENELSGNPVSTHFLKDYYQKFPEEVNSEN